MLPRDAFFAPADTVAPRKAVGRISAELVTPYPPGIPAVAPSEVYTWAIVDYLEGVVASDGFVEGTADPSLAKLRVNRCLLGC
jgi:arginine/lysine/ornithine decarboxylase